MNPAAKRPALAGTLAKGVASQGVLSAGNFAVGLILLRYASNNQYGYYALVVSGTLLLTSLQGAFVGPALVNQLTQLGLQGRSDLVGGLYVGQRWVLLWVAGVAAACIAILRAINAIDNATTGLLLVALAAAWTALYRQFFRMVCNAHRNSGAALRGDLLYVALLLSGAAIGILTTTPAIVTVMFMCVAAVAAGWENARLMRRHESWNVHATPRVWRGIAAVGAWTAAGSVAYWAFSQGYNYLVAGVVNLAALAALGLTRMLMMPVNLLSTGVSSLMLATVNVWLQEHGARSTLRRVALSAAGMAALALLYAALLWPLRDFVFSRVLHKAFAQRDLLLLVWWLTSVAMAVRDQFVNFLLARARYRSLTALSIITSIIALIVMSVMIERIGVAGAAVGVLVGEIVNILGLIALSRRDLHQAPGLAPISPAAWTPNPLEDSDGDSVGIADAGSATEPGPDRWPMLPYRLEPLKHSPLVAGLALRLLDLRTRHLERVIFTATTGRSGTLTLTKLFAAVPNCRAVHEPHPIMNGPLLQAASYGDAALVNRVYRRVKAVNIRRAAAGHQYYFEANHLFIKTFADNAVADFGRRIAVVHLVRPAVEVANSIYRLRDHPGTERGNYWWLDYRAPTNLISIAEILESDPEFSHPFYKALWYWHEIEARIAAWRSRVPAVDVIDFETRCLNDMERVCGLLERLGVQYESARLAQVVGAREHTKEHQKIGSALPSKEAEEKAHGFELLLKSLNARAERRAASGGTGD